MSFHDIERGSFEPKIIEQETPGIKAEEAVLAFLKSQNEFITEVEPTPKNGINDQHHIDAFVWLGKQRELPCAIDISGATRERRELKRKMDQVMPFVICHPEANVDPIPGEIPHFTLDIQSLGYWDFITTKIREGTPITEVMSLSEQKKVARSFLLQMLLQVSDIERRSHLDRKKVAPYRKALVMKGREIFSEKEMKALEGVFEGMHN